VLDVCERSTSRTCAARRRASRGGEGRHEPADAGGLGLHGVPTTYLHFHPPPDTRKGREWVIWLGGYPETGEMGRNRGVKRLRNPSEGVCDYGRGMARPGLDPQGKTTVVNVRLTPSLLERLDELAAQAGHNRAEVIRELIERSGTGYPPPRVASVALGGADTGCPHPAPVKMPTGLWRCDACDSVSHNRGRTWSVIRVTPLG
jgi:hypothetical protein